MHILKDYQKAWKQLHHNVSLLALSFDEREETDWVDWFYFLSLERENLSQKVEQYILAQYKQKIDTRFVGRGGASFVPVNFIKDDGEWHDLPNDLFETEEEEGLWEKIFIEIDNTAREERKTLPQKWKNYK